VRAIGTLLLFVLCLLAIFAIGWHSLKVESERDMWEAIAGIQGSLAEQWKSVAKECSESLTACSEQFKTCAGMQ
jgi:hypothetical protein